MKRFLTVILSLVLTAASFSVLVGCGGTRDENTLIVWCQSSDLKTIAEEYFAKTKEGVKIEATVLEPAALRQKLDNALSTGKGLPDVFAMEEAILSKYINSGALVDQTDWLTAAQKSDLYSSMLEEGRANDGKIYGYCYQMSPGAFYYRTDIAEAVWPGYDLEEIDDMIADWDEFLGMAETLKNFKNKPVPGFPDKLANGNANTTTATPSTGITLVAGSDQLSRMFFSEIDKPFVSADKTLQISANIIGGTDYKDNFLDNTKWLIDNGYCNKGQNYLYDTSGFLSCVSRIDNFGYMLPTWGLMTTILPQTENNTQVANTTGLWRCTAAPVNFAYGGTWIGVPKKAENQTLAKEFAVYCATNADFKKSYALNTMNYVNSDSLMSELATNLPATYADGKPNPRIVTNDDGSTGFALLGGQNHYSFLYARAKSFGGNKLSQYDAVIINAAIYWAGQYGEGGQYAQTKAAAIAEMKKTIASQAPDLKTA